MEGLQRRQITLSISIYPWPPIQRTGIERVEGESKQASKRRMHL